MFSRGQAWVDLIILANHKKSFFYKRGIKIDLERGQLAWSEKALSQRWQWSRTKVRKFLNDLEKEQQIGQQKSNVTQVITVINYDRFQEKEPQKDRKRTAKEPQKDTYNNDNNANNEKNENKNIPALKDFIDYAIEKEPSVDINEVRLKYLAWVENGWKDGNDRQVKNWKSKLLNTMLHLKKDETKTEKKTSIKF